MGRREQREQIFKLLFRVEFNTIEDELVKKMAFNLGMVEAISYWKSVCAEKLIVECGSLDSEQMEFFKKLFYLGLGEFRYINNIVIEQNEFIEITSKDVGVDISKNLQYNKTEGNIKLTIRKFNTNRWGKRFYCYFKLIR